jgi:hypothetical protein
MKKKHSGGLVSRYKQYNLRDEGLINSLPSGSHLEFGDHDGMIGWLFRKSRVHVYGAVYGFISQGRGGEDVVHPPSQPPFHGLGGPVVEEGILSGLIGMVSSEHIDQTPRFDRGKAFPDLRVKTDMPHNPLWVVHVYLLRGHIEIAAPDKGFPG